MLLTRMYHPSDGFYGPVLLTESAFDGKVAELCRELDERGKLAAPAQPQPAPAPAPVVGAQRMTGFVSEAVPMPLPQRGVPPSTPSLSPSPAARTAEAPDNFTPSVRLGSSPAGSDSTLQLQPTWREPPPPAASGGASAGGVASFEAMAGFLERQRGEVEARVKAEWVAQQRAAQQPELAAVSSEDIVALQARLERLHQIELLPDELLFQLEDTIADCLELVALHAGVVTHEMVYDKYQAGVVRENFAAVAQVHCAVAVSAGFVSDAALARQLRRKFAKQ